jgi:hypothetical protein
MNHLKASVTGITLVQLDFLCLIPERLLQFASTARARYEYSQNVRPIRFRYAALLRTSCAILLTLAALEFELGTFL